MAAYNWISFDGVCPACSWELRFRAQTHIAASYAGDSTGRFFDREYRIGERMAWWDPPDSRYAAWNEFADQNHPDRIVEACAVTCEHCKSQLFAIVEFRDLVPIRVDSIGLAENLPPNFDPL